jgi:hypothetical protein
MRICKLTDIKMATNTFLQLYYKRIENIFPCVFIIIDYLLYSLGVTRGVAKAMCLGGPRLAFADKVGVAKAWYGCGFGMVYDNDLIFL